MKRIIISSLVIFLTATTAFCQGLSYAAIQQDPTSAAMGGTDIASSSSFAALGNTSLVPFSKEKVSVGTSYMNWAPSSFGYFNFGTSVKVDKQKRIAVSAAALSGKGKAYQTTDSYGSPAGSFTPTELSVNGGVSGLITEKISVGASMGYLRQVLYDKGFNTSVAASAFMSILLSDFTVTFGGRSLGKDVPASIDLGGKWNKTFSDIHNVTLAAETNIYIEGNASLSTGAQYCLKDMLSLRAGFRYGGNSVIPSYGSLGAGFCYEGVHLDAAYLISNGINSPGNSFTVGLRFEL